MNPAGAPAKGTEEPTSNGGLWDGAAAAGALSNSLAPQFNPFYCFPPVSSTSSTVAPQFPTHYHSAFAPAAHAMGLHAPQDPTPSSILTPASYGDSGGQQMSLELTPLQPSSILAPKPLPCMAKVVEAVHQAGEMHAPARFNLFPGFGPFAAAHHQMAAQNGGSHQMGSEEDEMCGGGEGEQSGKRQRKRNLFSPRQVRELEDFYFAKKFITCGERTDLAKKIGLTPNQVKIWYQNRRYKDKKTEKDRKFNLKNQQQQQHQRSKKGTPNAIKSEIDTYEEEQDSKEDSDLSTTTSSSTPKASRAQQQQQHKSMKKEDGETAKFHPQQPPHFGMESLYINPHQYYASAAAASTLDYFHQQSQQQQQQNGGPGNGGISANQSANPMAGFYPQFFGHPARAGQAYGAGAGGMYQPAAHPYASSFSSFY